MTYKLNKSILFLSLILAFFLLINFAPVKADTLDAPAVDVEGRTLPNGVCRFAADPSNNQNVICFLTSTFIDFDGDWCINDKDVKSYLIALDDLPNEIINHENFVSTVFYFGVVSGNWKTINVSSVLQKFRTKWSYDGSLAYDVGKIATGVYLYFNCVNTYDSNKISYESYLIDKINKLTVSGAYNEWWTYLEFGNKKLFGIGNKTYEFNVTISAGDSVTYPTYNNRPFYLPAVNTTYNLIERGRWILFNTVYSNRVIIELSTTSNAFKSLNIDDTSLVVLEYIKDDVIYNNLDNTSFPDPDMPNPKKNKSCQNIEIESCTNINDLLSNIKWILIWSFVFIVLFFLIRKVFPLFKKNKENTANINIDVSDSKNKKRKD